MPIKETSSKEEYLFTEYRRGTSLLGVKDTGNPIALGLALAPVTFGLSLVAGLTESSERKKINKERFDKTYERQCVGEIVERNQFNFASVIKETNIKQKDYSFDFICPYCNRIIQSFSRDSNITFFEIYSENCSNVNKQFYWYIEKPNTLVVLTSYRYGEWALKEN